MNCEETGLMMEIWNAMIKTCLQVTVAMTFERLKPAGTEQAELQLPKTPALRYAEMDLIRACGNAMMATYSMETDATQPDFMK